jgi:hypothetical protein
MRGPAHAAIRFVGGDGQRRATVASAYARRILNAVDRAMRSRRAGQDTLAEVVDAALGAKVRPADRFLKA